jgi:hypothetical protein
MIMVPPPEAVAGERRREQEGGAGYAAEDGDPQRGAQPERAAEHRARRPGLIPNEPCRAPTAPFPEEPPSRPHPPAAAPLPEHPAVPGCSHMS